MEAAVTSSFTNRNRCEIKLLGSNWYYYYLANSYANKTKLLKPILLQLID